MRTIDPETALNSKEVILRWNKFPTMKPQDASHVIICWMPGEFFRTARVYTEMGVDAKWHCRFVDELGHRLNDPTHWAYVKLPVETK